MKILCYTENYASETVTFITNELKYVQESHELLLIYSNRKNPDRYSLNYMLEIPYRFNKIINKLRWWLEQFELYFFLYNLSFKKKLNKAISDFKPDIIHCHFGTDFLKVVSNLNNSNRHIPILISFYGFDVTERIKNKAVLRQYIKYMALPNVFSVAVSSSLVNNINNFIKPTNLAIPLNSGIDTDFFVRKPTELNPSEFVFLQVSSFTFKKGHKYTLQAFKKFIDQNKLYRYKFIIAGFGPLENEIKNQIKELHLEEYVFLQGPVTPSEMVNLASRVNCFVHMSVTADNGDQEGLPNVLLEAMSLELPILSTFHAGIPEIVEHTVNGILCEEKNINQYVEAFNNIVNWKISPINRTKIIELFSINAHMKTLNNLYNDINNHNY